LPVIPMVSMYHVVELDVSIDLIKAWRPRRQQRRTQYCIGVDNKIEDLKGDQRTRSILHLAADETRDPDGTLSNPWFIHGATNACGTEVWSRLMHTNLIHHRRTASSMQTRNNQAVALVGVVIATEIHAQEIRHQGGVLEDGGSPPPSWWHFPSQTTYTVDERTLASSRTLKGPPVGGFRPKF
jgi:hypothetical protein